MRIHHFENIYVDPDKERIFSRLGYRRGKTKIPALTLGSFNEIFYEASGIIRIKGASRLIDINEIKKQFVYLSENHVFHGTLPVKTLSGCSLCLLMAATVNKEYEEKKNLLHLQDLTRAVIYDAVASELVDSGLDWISEYMALFLLRESKKISTRQISCGYGDFPLSDQSTICTLLDLKKIGITLKDTYMLQPEKSVTAIAGVK